MAWDLPWKKRGIRSSWELQGSNGSLLHQLPKLLRRHLALHLAFTLSFALQLIALLSYFSYKGGHNIHSLHYCAANI